jgi:hypothetical protein
VSKMLSERRCYRSHFSRVDPGYFWGKTNEE